MYQHDPRRKRNMQSIIGAFCVVFVLLILLLIFGRSTNGVYDTISALLILLCSLLLFLLGLIGILMVVENRRVDHVREHAAHGDQKRLTAEQPVANEHALPLPTTIKLQLDKKRFFLGMGILYMFFYGLFTFFINWNGKSFLAHFFAVFITIFLFALFMTVTQYFLTGRSMGQTLTVDEQGITAAGNGFTTHVAWQDANFFRVQTAGLQRATSYQLASSEAVVYWSWVRPIKELRLLSVLQPTVPFEEYNVSMAALLLLIEAKTRLPLYELGKVGKTGEHSS